MPMHICICLSCEYLIRMCMVYCEVLFSISMGVAADSWMAFTDRFLTLDDNSDEKNNLKKKMLKLIDIYYDALDAPKTGKEVTMLLFFVDAF